MDNCIRENKNKYVLAFLTYLVQKKIFVEQKLTFVNQVHADLWQAYD